MQLLHAVLRYDDKTHELPVNKTSFFDELFVEFKVEQLANKGQRIWMTMHPKVAIKLQEVSLHFSHSYQGQERVFCNGFQSWTQSREFRIKEEIQGLRPIANRFMKNYGDYHIHEANKDILHSWNYSYFRLKDNRLNFIGSLNEHTGYTIFKHEHKVNKLVVEKDCEGMTLQHSFPIINLLVLEGDDKTVFDQYFELMGTKKPTAKPIVGWTSWYHYYTNISEEIILKNLNAFAHKQVPLDIFQIDDGYQQRVGDWLDIKPNFPNGMASIAQKIHESGYKAGLWLAPFICEKKSKIFEQKQDWLLKDDNGKPISGGYNPGWSGHFYVLDFYNEEVQEYITGVLFKVLKHWDYDMVKLDFLYAAALLPRSHRNRGQVMYDVMTFLRNIVGEKWILACGVPLGQSFGLVDYCRIGADVHLKWEHGLLKWLRNRERVSTYLSLQSTLGRWQLNGRAFHNDPDVFMLRTDKTKLTSIQQHTLLVINILLGNVLFTSDYVGDYTDEQWAEYNLIFQWKDRLVEYVSQEGDLYRIYFSVNGVNYVALCNLGGDKKTVILKGKGVDLEGYETEVLGC